MKGLLERVRAGDILVADGAIGTMLMARGLERGQPPESFNLARHDVLEAIAAEYLKAGADIVQTNTFGGSRLKLAQYALGGKVTEINRNAVIAVRKSVGDRAYVSGSCGPTGPFLRPYGDIEPEEMIGVFREQIAALVDAGVDVICIETMIDLHEAVCAVTAARQVSRSVPVMATMTFDQTPRGFYTIMGASILDAVKGLEAAGADIIGSNCGNGIEKMVLIAREFKEHTALPVIIQSNAGLPELRGAEVVYPETPDFMAQKALELVEIGVSIIGGCCGTTPQHIRALKNVVDARRR